MKTKMNYITLMTLLLVGAITYAQSVDNATAGNSAIKVQISAPQLTVQPTIPSSNGLLAANELINYQAVALDGSGNPISNAAVTVDVEIRDGAGGSAEFNETHNPTTDANGVFSIQVGSVNPLDAVNWADIEAYLQVDLNGTDMGESSIGSAATALHSKQSDQIMMFGSGTSNADKMIAQHSPAFPGWGIGYTDATDEVDFMAGGNKNLSIELGSGNLRTDGTIEIGTTTASPAVNRVYGNSMPIAYGSIDSVGGISTGYGITSVTNSATGVYEIVLDLNTNAANTVVTLTPFTGSFGTPEIMGYEATGGNTFTVRIMDVTGAARDSAFAFTVYPQ